MGMAEVPNRRETVEIADIFRRFGPRHVARLARGIGHDQGRAMRAIAACRTAELGGHVERCDRCGAERVSYNSCRNRHCPKCQFLRQERWLLMRGRDALPVPYFHLVFTLPASLNPLALANRRAVYNLLLRCASETVLCLAANERFLGAKVGMLCVLHTWGQTLAYHPHVHCIVTGGGLAPDGSRWIAPRPDFLIPVRVLSRLFRGKFLAGLGRLAAAGGIAMPGRCAGLADPQRLREFIGRLWRTEWVVHCKPPFASPAHLFKYLARYTHRVAIANSRILEFDDRHVWFRYRDYADGDRQKVLRLSGEEFVRRFLLHVLPARFVKVRQYGLLANRGRERLVAACRQALNSLAPPGVPHETVSDWRLLLKLVTGRDAGRCAVCGSGRMVLAGIVGRTIRPP